MSVRFANSTLVVQKDGRVSDRNFFLRWPPTSAQAIIFFSHFLFSLALLLLVVEICSESGLQDNSPDN